MPETPKWEYAEVPADNWAWELPDASRVMGEMGEEGWELVSRTKGVTSAWDRGTIVGGVPCTILTFKRRVYEVGE